MTVTNAELASQIEAFVASVTVRDELFYEWQTGSATGGPNGDGTYPLTDFAGFTRMLKSPAAMLGSLASAVGTVSVLVENRSYATQALLYADLAPADNQFALVYDDPDAAKNDLYVKVGATGAGSWSGPSGVFGKSAQAFVQPLVDAASASAALADANRIASETARDAAAASASASSTSASDTANSLKPIRALNQYAQPTFADGALPAMQSGAAGLVAVTPASLVALGAVNGAWNSAGTSSTTTTVKVPVAAADVGKYVYMSYYFVQPTTIVASTNLPGFRDAANALITDTLTRGQELVETGPANAYYVYRAWAYGVIPAGTAFLNIGRGLAVRSASHYITGVTYRISRWPLTSLNFKYDDIAPVLDPVAIAQAADAKVAVVDAKIDATARTILANKMANGDYVLGDQVMRSGSPVVALSQEEFTSRGLRRGVQWRAGNDYARYSNGSALNGKYFFGAVIVSSVDASNLLTGIASFSEDTGAVLHGTGSQVTGYLDISATTRLVWITGQVTNATDVNLLIGSAVTPPVAGTLFASGWTVFLSATPIDKDEAIRQMGFASKARVQARSAADAAVAAFTPAAPRAKLVLGGTGAVDSYIEAQRGGNLIRRTVRPWPVTTLTASCVFNFISDTVDSFLLRTCGDDAAPYRAFNPVVTVGANHGFSMTLLTAAGHGKTAADVGQVLASGGNQYVIVGYVSSSQLYVTARTTNNAAPVAAYTYVSGGTNTGGFTATVASAVSMYPPFSNRKITLFVDDLETTATTGTLEYKRSVVFRESYDVASKTDIVEWIIANGNIIHSAAPSFTVSNSYEFDVEGHCTCYQDFLCLKAMQLQDIMFLQGANLNAGDGTVKLYIPKALPLTHQGIAYNYALKDSIDTSAWAGNRLDITPARAVATGILVDRAVMLSDTYGFALGYAPVQSAGVTQRRIEATVKGIQINDAAAKIYMSAIDKGLITLAPGDYFSVIGYRNVIVRSTARTDAYPVRTQGADYFYVDWHDKVVLDRVPLPSDFAGRTFTVVESRNCTLKSQALTNSIAVDVNCAGDYAYLILQVA